MPRTVIAIDDDIGFLFALASHLESARVVVIPSGSVALAERLLQELALAPDVLVINCRIRGVGAFAARVRRRWPDLKVVAIVSERGRCGSSKAIVKAFLPDQRPRRAETVRDWARLLRATLGESGVADRTSN